jgi:gas vesicle protein
MNRLLAIIGGVGAGVAAAYFLDPKKGADRRALVRDKFNSLKEDASHKITEATESFRQQANGFASDAKAMIGDGTKTTPANPRQQSVH